MLRNYIKIAWRNLYKHKVYSFITILGLSVGLACCILLGLFVRFEWAHDKFHENSEHLYRIVADHKDLIDGPGKTASTPPRLAAELEESFPEIDKAVRVIPKQLKIDTEKNTFEEEVHFADPGFFKVFTFPFTEGSPHSVLGSQNNIVLTERISKKLFNSVHTIGQSVTVNFENDQRIYTVAAVVEKPPALSSIQFDIILPFSSYQ